MHSKIPPEQQELAVYAKRLETLLKNLPGMAYRCLNESHWPMDFVSSGCFDLCGYYRDEIESQSVLWGDFTHPADIDEVDRLVRTATDKRQPFETEYRIITKIGELKWVWERGRVVDVRDDGVAILEGFITDITSRKISETELRHSQAYAQAIVESAAEAVVTIDEYGTIESINRSTQTMFGYQPHEIIATHSSILISPSKITDYDRILLNHGLSAKPVETRYEIEARHKEGNLFPVVFSVNNIEATLGDKRVMMIRDISRQRENEKEMREQRELIAHADRLNTLGEMAAGIAHEINQPLTAISTYAQSGLGFLRNDTPNTARIEDGLEKISLQAHRAGSVIQRMQVMAKQQQSHQEFTDLSLLIREIYRLAEVEAHTRNYIIELNLRDNIMHAYCDPVQIQQVILNLLRNGMESMSEFGCAQNAKIVLLAENVSNGVKIAVVDCGGGITDQLASQLYQSFASTKKYGMGMGLSISRSIISSHGSSLEFSNNETDGAAFYFILSNKKPERLYA